MQKIASNWIWSTSNQICEESQISQNFFLQPVCLDILALSHFATDVGNHEH